MEFNEQIWWYASRASGLVSLGLLTLSVLWGLALSTKVMGRAAPAPWLLDLHRYLSMWSIVFVGVHVVALVPDNYVHFGWAELFLPGASEWKAGAVAWGIVAFYLLVAVEISSYFMKRIPRKLWRMLHFTSFALWVVAVMHSITAGSDATSRAFTWTAVAAVQIVLFFTIARILTARRLKRALAASRTDSTVDAVRADRLAALQARRS